MSMDIIINNEGYSVSMIHEIEKAVDVVLVKWGISRTGTAFNKDSVKIDYRYFAELLDPPKEHTDE